MAPGPWTYSLRDLAGTFRVADGSPTVEASYRVASADGTAHRCELKLTRDRSGKELRTTLAFKTAEGLPLPASPTLDPFFTAADWLGPTARVQGELTLSKAGAGDWEAAFVGELIDVDLAALVGRRVPDHRLSGRARVAIESARWGVLPGGTGSGWVEARGELTAGPGSISTSLMRALQAEMSFRLDPRLDLRPADLEYQNFGIAFAMTPDGEIELAGTLGTDSDPGAVLSEGLVSMAYAPAGASNVLGLHRTLGPQDSDPVLVPLTPELRFLEFLPVPAGPRGGHAVGN